MSQTQTLVVSARTWVPFSRTSHKAVIKSSHLEYCETISSVSKVDSSTPKLASPKQHGSSNVIVSPTSKSRTLDFDQLFACLTDVSDAFPSLFPALATALLLSFHHESLVADLWIYAASKSPTTTQQASLARTLREACLKSSALVGFPRAINALSCLRSAISKRHPHLNPLLESDTSLRAPISTVEKQERGKAFFSRIYAHHTGRVLSAMDASSGGDLTHFALNCIYGEFLAEFSIIGEMETGLLEFVCCLADGCAPQAKGHFFGSINLGASNEVLRGTLRLTNELAKQLGIGRPWQGEGNEWKFLDKATL